MYEAEVPKEFLRDAFQSGALDITGSFEMVQNFVRIFAGEMEALIAVGQCQFLTPKQVKELTALAVPTRDTARHYRAWLDRIHS